MEPAPGPSNPPHDSATAIVGVYRSEAAATEVALRAIEFGADADSVRVGVPADRDASAVGEMREEMERIWIVPGVGGPYPGEAARSTLKVGVVLIGLAVVVALAIGAALPSGGIPLWLRLVLAVAVGAAAGAAATIVIGPSLAASHGDERVAADRGVVVHVSPASRSLQAMMAAHEPLRLDRFDGDEAEAVVAPTSAPGANRRDPSTGGDGGR